MVCMESIKVLLKALLSLQTREIPNAFFRNRGEKQKNLSLYRYVFMGIQDEWSFFVWQEWLKNDYLSYITAISKDNE